MVRCPNAPAAAHSCTKSSLSCRIRRLLLACCLFYSCHGSKTGKIFNCELEGNKSLSKEFPPEDAAFRLLPSSPLSEHLEFYSISKSNEKPPLSEITRRLAGAAWFRPVWAHVAGQLVCVLQSGVEKLTGRRRALSLGFFYEEEILVQIFKILGNKF